MIWIPLLRRPSCLVLTLALVTFAGARPSLGEGAPAAPGRSADAILADYAKALGAPGTLRRKKSLHAKRDVVVQGMGVTGTEERWAAAGNKLLSVTTLPGIGVIRQGSTGAARWSEDPINGLRVLKGAEDEESRIESTWAGDLQLRKLYKKARTVPVPDGAPKDPPLECVELEPRVARPVTMCFDAKTHLRVYLAGKHATPQGEVPYSARLSDWREVDGVQMPFREETTAGPMTIEARVTQVKFDEKLPPALFKMPKPGAPPPAPAPPAGAAPPGAAAPAPPAAKP